MMLINKPQKSNKELIIDEVNSKNIKDTRALFLTIHSLGMQTTSNDVTGRYFAINEYAKTDITDIVMNL